MGVVLKKFDFPFVLQFSVSFYLSSVSFKFVNKVPYGTCYINFELLIGVTRDEYTN